MKQKFPPFGKELDSRIRYNNRPFLVIICVGSNAWNSAKKWKKNPDIEAMVLTPDDSPERLKWPVHDCLCIVEWNTGPAVKIIVRLVQCLLAENALSVTVYPIFVDHSEPAFLYYDKAWHIMRDRIRTFANKELMHGA